MGEQRVDNQDYHNDLRKTWYITDVEVIGTGKEWTRVQGPAQRGPDVIDMRGQGQAGLGLVNVCLELVQGDKEKDIFSLP